MKIEYCIRHVTSFFVLDGVRYQQDLLARLENKLSKRLDSGRKEQDVILNKWGIASDQITAIEGARAMVDITFFKNLNQFCNNKLCSFSVFFN